MSNEKVYTPGDEHKPALNEDAPELPPPGDNADADPGPCPITLLGSASGFYSFLTPRGEKRVYAAREFSKTTITDLFDQRVDWLWKKWPTRDSKGNRSGWNATSAIEYLIRESARLPKFNMAGRERGPGTWRAEGDRTTPDHLIVHTGDRLYVNLPDDAGGGWRGVGKYRGYIYPLYSPEPGISDKPATTQEMNELLALLKTWTWHRPDVDPRLLIGWLGVATVCGALKWRSSLWLTGDKATGKSTLQDLIRRILGDMILQVAEPTEAFLRQELKGASRPVEIDEFEADVADWKRQSIITLIRLGSTRDGAGIGRGSASGQTSTYNIDATFLLSSILPPPLSPENTQRITTLELGEVVATPADSLRVTASIRMFGGLGRRIIRRLLNRWEEVQVNMEMIATALVRAHHQGRAADQYKSLLACADILLSDDPLDGDSIEEMIKHLDPRSPDAGGDEQSNSKQCLSYLLTSAAPDWQDGKRLPILELVRRAIFDAKDRAIRHRLAAIGIRVDPFQIADGRECMCLAIAGGTHQGMAKVFEGTYWQTVAGRPAPWARTLKRYPGAVEQQQSERFGGFKHRAVLIPLDCLDIEARLEDHEADTPPPDPANAIT